MAVTQIRKMSSWTLLTLLLASTGVLAAFYFGGYVDPTVEQPEPVYTGLLLNFTYAIALLTIAATVVFAFSSFARTLMHKPSQAIKQLTVIVVAIALMFTAYSLGDGTKLEIMGYDGPDNTEFWLKMSDMFFYSIYALMILIILCITAAGVKKAINK